MATTGVDSRMSKQKYVSACYQPRNGELDCPDNPCPYNCSGGLFCMRWGSGTPLIEKNKCFVKDLETCPLTEYPNETNIVFWKHWLDERDGKCLKTKNINI